MRETDLDHSFPFTRFFDFLLVLFENVFHLLRFLTRMLVLVHLIFQSSSFSRQWCKIVDLFNLDGNYSARERSITSKRDEPFSSIPQPVSFVSLQVAQIHQVDSPPSACEVPRI